MGGGMEGLVGVISGFVAAFIAFIFFVIVGLHGIFAIKSKEKLLQASLTAFVVMLGFVLLFGLVGEEGKYFPVAYYDWLGPAWIIAAIVLALLVYGSGAKSSEDEKPSYLDKWDRWG